VKVCMRATLGDGACGIVPAVEIPLEP